MLGGIGSRRKGHEIGRGAQGDSCGATEVRSPWTWRGGKMDSKELEIHGVYWWAAGLGSVLLVKGRHHVPN